MENSGLVLPSLKAPQPGSAIARHRLGWVARSRMSFQPISACRPSQPLRHRFRHRDHLRALRDRGRRCRAGARCDARTLSMLIHDEEAGVHASGRSEPVEILSMAVPEASDTMTMSTGLPSTVGPVSSNRQAISAIRAPLFEELRTTTPTEWGATWAALSAAISWGPQPAGGQDARAPATSISPTSSVVRGGIRSLRRRKVPSSGRHHRPRGVTYQRKSRDGGSRRKVEGSGPDRLRPRIAVLPTDEEALMDIKALQRPLRERYEADPDSAPLTLTVRSAPSDLTDPLHCAVAPDSIPGLEWRSGAHRAVGGVGDVPCSADLLLGALVACQEVTLRMVAANLGIELAHVEVVVEGDWDPRGTLGMGREYPVGLTAIRCRTKVKAGGRGRRRPRRPAPAERRALLRGAEYAAGRRRRPVDLRDRGRRAHRLTGRMLIRRVGETGPVCREETRCRDTSYSETSARSTTSTSSCERARASSWSRPSTPRSCGSTATSWPAPTAPSGPSASICAPGEDMVRDHADAMGGHQIEVIYEIGGDVAPSDFTS